MRIAYQGEPGAYSEAAALQFGGPEVETLPCKSFDEVFEAVVKKRATHGVVPLENSIGGTIHRNYDLLLDHELGITGEVELDIVHCLQALPGTTVADVKTVYSHPQALAQCERYLKGLGIPRERMHLRVHEGHCTYLVPEERRFITPEVIRASGGLVGEPDEILAMLKAHEAAGLREVTLLPPMANARELYREFAEQVMARAR